MDEYLQQEQDDAFFQAMRELGDSIRDKIKGKTLMVNPAAMKKAAAIMGYFKKLKKEDDEGEKTTILQSNLWWTLFLWVVGMQPLL